MEAALAAAPVLVCAPQSQPGAGFGTQSSQPSSALNNLGIVEYSGIVALQVPPCPGMDIPCPKHPLPFVP